MTRTPHDFKTTDASSYDPFADQFDAFASRLCAPFADRMLRLAQVAPAQQIVDIGTGTGLVALRAGARVGPQGRVIGIDLSDGMLQIARRNAIRDGLRHVEFRKMDAEALEVEDRSCDAALSLFALTHFPDPLAALREMCRVLRPGGRLVIGVGGMPGLWSRHFVRLCLRRVRREVLERQGKQLTAPHFLDGLTRHYLGSLTEREETEWAGHRFGRAAMARRLVRHAGFRVTSFDWHAEEAHLDTPEAFWEIQSTWSSIARKRVLAAPPHEVAALREAFLRRCREVLASGGALAYPLAAFYISARKP